MGPSRIQSLRGYNVYRSLEGQPYEFLDYIDDPTAATYVDSILISTTACYKINALYISNTDTCISDFSNDACLWVNIPETDPFVSLSINPNPASDQFVISCKNCYLKEISIHDITGKIIYNCYNETNSDKIKIDTHSYNPGIYIIKIRTDHETSGYKLIVY